MNLLVYANLLTPPARRLWQKMQELCRPAGLEVLRDLVQLSERLRRPAAEVAAAVVLAGTPAELLALSCLRDLLPHQRLILILPDREAPTIALAHTMRPRFIEYLDSDFDDVIKVALHLVQLADKDPFYQGAWAQAFNCAGQ